jgi:hypothetical protein
MPGNLKSLAFLLISLSENLFFSLLSGKRFEIPHFARNDRLF